MWQAMMVAMMTPAVAPWVRTYARLVDNGRPGRRWAASLSFAGGYFAAWLAYSAAAAFLQLGLSTLMPVPHTAASQVLAGAVLAAAGGFQFAPWKQACLTHCRSPLSYLVSRWIDGPLGGFRLGLSHGAYCVGCCWLLMLTGLAVGAMNLSWMAIVALVAALEQIAPGGPWLGRLFGIGLIMWGLAIGWAA
jgi:predicted metal-binding membrane protein